MSELSRWILTCLEEVATEREQRIADPALLQKVVEVKAYQHRRFQVTYADLLQDPTMQAAATFFLDELYGPKDFTQRDAQFARVVPAMVKLFSTEISHTVLSLGRLHALSERLDTAMGVALLKRSVEESSYRQAWRMVGDAGTREHQIELMLEVGLALQRLVRQPLLRGSLRLMRAPASKAGLGSSRGFWSPVSTHSSHCAIRRRFCIRLPSVRLVCHANYLECHQHDASVALRSYKAKGPVK